MTDAEDLFRRAKALLADKRAAEACPLFHESYRLDPGMGTLLNLALCDEQIGKVASAWGAFRAVEQQARAAVPPNESRAQLAREHADKLQPRLSRLRIVVPPESRVPGLTVKLDGEEKAEPVWVGIPVDVGTRVVEVSGTNRLPVLIRLKVEDEASLQTVTVPLLADAPPAAVPVAGGANLEEFEAFAATRARRTSGYVIGGIGLGIFAAGAVFGIAGIINDNTAKECAPCFRGSTAAADSDKATDRALVFANIANVTVPLGALATAFGAYLVVSAKSEHKVKLTPVATSGHAGVSLDGAW